MDTGTLLGRHRAEHAAAKRYFALSEGAQRMLVVVALAIALVGTKGIDYLGSLVSLLLSIAWIWCDQAGQRAHQRAERGRRLFQLIDGLGFVIHGKLMTDLLLSFRSPVEQVERNQDQGYYASKSDRGVRRFAENLHESAFWSRYLYSECRTRAWIKFGVYLVVLILGLLVYPAVISFERQATFFKAFCMLLAALVTGSTFIQAFGYSRAVGEVEKIETSLDWIIRDGSDNIENVLVLFIEYGSITDQTHPIPESVYRENRDKLNTLWNHRAKSSGDE